MISTAVQAFNAYTETLRSRGTSDAAAPTGGDSLSSNLGASSDSGISDGGDFGSLLNRAIGKVVQSGHQAENLAAQGLSGSGDATQIVTAVANAQLALQTTTVLRDRFVQAYQDVMRMAI